MSTKPIVVELDELCRVCGYFNSETELNNGYGCDHPDNVENRGKCYSFSCPIATECNLEDLKEHSPEDYELWEDEDNDPAESGAQLMLIDDAELQIKLGYTPTEESPNLFDEFKFEEIPTFYEDMAIGYGNDREGEEE